MTPSDLPRQALRQAHVYLEIKRGLCPESRLYEALPGATIGPIAAIYAHTVVNEDAYVQRDRKGEAPLFERQEWASKLAFPPKVALDPEWPATFRTDLTLFGEYARAVYAASDAYLAGLGASDLAFEVPKYLASLEEGKPAVRRRLVALGFDFEDMVTLHVSEHAGEISAVLGAMGLQGSAWG